MTYDEAAALLSIKPDSVRRRAALRKWPKRQGNDRLARVGIPEEIIPDHIPVTTHDESGVIAELAAAKATINGLQDRLADTQADRDSWRSQAETLSKSIGEARTGFWSRIFRT